MKLFSSPWLRLVLVAALFVAWYFFLPQYLSIGITLMLLAGWATAWDLLGGWTGQASLGPAAFVGLGAYTIAIMSSKYGTHSWAALVLSMILAVILAWLWGKLTFGMRGAYFTLSTIAIAEILRLVAINERQLTGGAVGIFIFSLDEPFGLDLFSRHVEFHVSLVYLLIVLAVVILVTRGRFGYQMRAVREDENSAMAAGISPSNVKLKAFMLSAALTAAGGVIYGVFLSALQPQPMFELPLSVRIALVAIIGGRGTIFGPLVGAILVTVASEVFRNIFADANLLIYGALIVFVIIFMPRGIMGEIQRRLVRRRYASSRS